MNKLFKDLVLLEEDAVEARKRRLDLTYTEKKTKNVIEKVIVELQSNESGAMTRLAGRYLRLDQAIKVMGEKRKELNAVIKGQVEELFAAEDVVLTRVIETVSFTLTVSKQSKVDDKLEVDYAAIAADLAKLIPDELQAKVDEIVAMYTKTIPQADKSPALNVKSKVTEGLIGDILDKVVAKAKTFLKKITSWGTSYDKKLDKLIKTFKLTDADIKKIKITSLPSGVKVGNPDAKITSLPSGVKVGNPDAKITSL